MNPLVYQPRQLRAYPPMALSRRTLKLYGLFSDSAKIAQMPAPAALHDAIAPLCAVPADATDHGLGFAIVHLAQDGDYLLISHWIDANMLKHQVYQCQVDEHGMTALRSLAASGIVACVWELEVMKFERDAWIRTVLGAGVLDGASRQAYLATRCEGWV